MTHNLEHGPKQSEERRSEHRSSLAECYGNRKARLTPVFLSLVPDMVYELETFQGVQLEGAKPIEEEVWDYCASRIVIDSYV